MPILDLGADGVYELPDDASMEEMQSFADSFKKPAQPAWQKQMTELAARNFPVFNPEEQRIPASEIPQNRLQFEIQGAQQTPQLFDTTQPFKEEPITQFIMETAPKKAGKLLDEIGTGIYEGGVDVMQRGAEAVQGIPRDVGGRDLTTQEAIKTYPKPVQVGIKVGEGLTKSAPRMAIAAINPVAGAAAFGMTEEGFDPKSAIIAGALPFIGSNAGLLTEAIALKTGLSNPQVLQALNRIGGVTGAAALIGADEAHRISQLPPEQREEAWLNAAANVGSQFLLGAMGPMERPAISKVAGAIESAPIETGRQVIDPAILRSELPPRIATPDMLPELQRTSELVNRAIQEAQQKIFVPGQPSALQQLREMQVAERVGQQEAARTTPRSQQVRSTEAEANPRFGVSGVAMEPRVFRTADDILLERQAEQAKRSGEPIPSVEEQGPRQVPTEPPRGSPIFRPTPGEFNQKQIDFQKRKQREAVEEGLYLEQPEFKTEIPEPPSRQYPAEGMGTGVLSKAQRRKALARQRAAERPSAEKAQQIASEKASDNQSIQKAAEFFNDNVAEVQAATASQIRNVNVDRLKGAYGSLERIIAELERSGIPAETEYRLLDKVDRELNRRGEQPPPAGFSPQDILAPKTTEPLAAPKESATPIKEAPQPKPPTGERLVEIVDKDGNVTIGSFGDKTYDFTAIGRGIVPHVGRYVNDAWSHGTLAPGETIREISTPTAQAPTTKTATQPLTVEQKLQGLKFDETGNTKLYSLPHPDAIKQIGKQLWNDSIDVAIASIKAGKVVKDAIGDAITHIKRNARNYDETQIRTNLEQILREEGITPKKPAAKPAVAAEAAPESIPAKGIEVPEGQKPRSFSARGTVSEKVPAAVQEQLRTDPRSSYTPQNIPETVSDVSRMDSAKLAAMGVDDNRFGAAKLELIKRLSKLGDNRSVLEIYQDASEKMTRAGQIINQAKLLNALKPETQVIVINDTLKKAGKDLLTEAQTQKVLDLGRASEKAKGELDAATTEWKNNPTPENAAKADKLLEAKSKIDLELQRFANAYNPKTWPGLLKAILQGNLLTPMSESVNIISHLTFNPFRTAARAGASAFDIIEAYATGSESRTSKLSPLSGSAETLKGFGRGAKQIPGIAMRGTGSTVLGESRAGIQPIKAWQNLFSNNPEMATTAGKKTFNDKMKLLVEGTFGIPAEVMLRGLGAGDAPFREAARARVITEQLKLNNVPKDQWGMAMKFPELFFNKETLNQIHNDSMGAIFQRESKSLNWFNQLVQKRGGPWADFFVATVAPYKVTPWNIISEIMSFNPVVAFAKAGVNAAKGDRRATNQNLGKFLVGSTLTAAGYALYKDGLLAPSLDAKDERQKERILAGEVLPPNHINISGLKRKLEGGDSSFKAGDETVDVFRAGGLAGAIFYMTANIGRDMEKNPEGDTSDLLWSMATQSTLEQARFGMNQSFLSGVEGLLTSVKDGNTDKWVKQYANTLTSIPLPNSLNTLSRATRDYKPDTSGRTTDEGIKNQLKSKLGIFGAGKDLPLKRGLWGEPIRETPKGENPIAYHFFDVSRGKQITDDPKALELYRLWRKTDDTKVIPEPPKDEQTFGNKTYILTPEQQGELAEKVGTIRKEIVDSLVLNPDWHKLPDEAKIKLLEKVYRKGLEAGKSRFFYEHQTGLTEKKPKAGFNPSRQ